MWAKTQFYDGLIAQIKISFILWESAKTKQKKKKKKKKNRKKDWKKRCRAQQRRTTAAIGGTCGGHSANREWLCRAVCTGDGSTSYKRTFGTLSAAARFLPQIVFRTFSAAAGLCWFRWCPKPTRPAPAQAVRRIGAWFGLKRRTRPGWTSAGCEEGRRYGLRRRREQPGRFALWGVDQWQRWAWCRWFSFCFLPWWSACCWQSRTPHRRCS